MNVQHVPVDQMKEKKLPVLIGQLVLLVTSS